ncbi:MAG: hypothetical protein V7607_1632 [Solirubrobacteraceae bacterium]
MDLPTPDGVTHRTVIELVPDCGHWIPAERADLVAQRVLSPA